mgnify:FL=1
MNIAVLGAGSWGTTLAHLLSRKHAVRLWARSIESVTEINQAKTLKRYLGDARLHAQLQAMSDIEQATSGADFVIMAIPSQSFGSVLSLAAPFIGKGTPIISVSKGLELSSLRRMTEIIRAQCPDMPAGVLTGQIGRAHV